MHQHIRLKTPRHLLDAVLYSEIIAKDDVVVRRELFHDMCRTCPNYGQKYACPPYSPAFDVYTKGSDSLFVVLLRLDLSQLEGFGYKEYHKLRMANAIIKPRLDNFMRLLEERFNSSHGKDSRYLSNGSCRLCKPCGLKLKKPCRYPARRRCSLEATGVDCTELSRRAFNLELLWYKDKKIPEYTVVICALALHKEDSEKMLDVFRQLCAGQFNT